MKITTANIYEEICKVTTEDERANWQSDLYCKVTPATRDIVNRYEYKRNVEIFKDNIDGEPWYDIPFVYPLRRGGM